MTFNPTFNNSDPLHKNAYWFILKGDKLLLVNKPDGLEIPFAEETGSLGLKPAGVYQIGMLGGNNCYTAYLENDMSFPECYSLVALRQAFGSVPDEIFWIAARAFHLQNWLKSNRFCGCCGSRMDAVSNERALKCTSCESIVYPRISPAIITAVIRGDEILLARAKRFPSAMYSVIAGFVEPGETLEQCVAREVREEVGIEVKNVRYFSSQPWPFPDSLMVAFTAEYSSGEIEIDNVEIEATGWYTRDRLPEIPSQLSVARKLIDWYLEKK